MDRQLIKGLSTAPRQSGHRNIFLHQVAQSLNQMTDQQYGPSSIYGPLIPLRNSIPRILKRSSIEHYLNESTNH